MSLERATDAEVAKRQAAAASMASALTRAGFAVHVAEGVGTSIPGVEIVVDPFRADEGGGVYVGWHVGGELVEDFSAPLLAQDWTHPALTLHGAIAEAMYDALMRVLVASGFDVVPTDNDMSPLSIKLIV
ncbi:hypothetical protein [Kribbella sp. NPDC051137]|uniref:hypothetical protein n=1 Tax=Kribbella sp. NPDC051137 TaxID=3155045 RepID=UPI003449D700